MPFRIIINTIFLPELSRWLYKSCFWRLYASLIFLRIRFLSTALLKVFFGILMAICAGAGKVSFAKFQITWKGWQFNDFPLLNSSPMVFRLQSLSCFLNVSGVALIGKNLPAFQEWYHRKQEICPDLSLPVVVPVVFLQEIVKSHRHGWRFGIGGLYV